MESHHLFPDGQHLLSLRAAIRGGPALQGNHLPPPTGGHGGLRRRPVPDQPIKKTPNGVFSYTTENLHPKDAGIVRKITENLTRF